MKANAVFTCLLIPILLLPLAAARAACTGPAGVESQIVYNQDYHMMQYCNGSTWISFAAIDPAAGGGTCSDPVRDEGVIVYNNDHHMLQFCDGTNWIGIGGGNSGSSGPPTGCATIGNVCSDGTVYAGISPDGNVPMYTTPASAPLVTPWDNGMGNNVDTAMVNCTTTSQTSCKTGAANTVLLAGLSNSASPYGAASYCDSLVAYGHDDWYLPAFNELSILYANRAAIGGFVTTDTYPTALYTSSSESGVLDRTRSIYFYDGSEDTELRSKPMAVRCVRK